MYYRVSNGGTIVDKAFTVLFSRDMNADSHVTRTISLSEDVTEVILIAASSYDSSAIKVNSHSNNMTEIYKSRLTAYYNASGYVWVYSKKKGQSASINFTVSGGRLIAR